MRLVAVVLSLLGTADAAEPFSDFAERGSVTGVGAPGLYRIPLEEPVWRHSRAPQPLADLRIVGPGDRELPWLARPIPVERPPQPHVERMEVRTRVDGSVVVVLDLGPQHASHDRVSLVSGPGDYVRPVTVDASDDGVAWQPIAAGGIVYQLGSAPPPNASLRVSYPRTRARFVRVTLAAGPSPAVIEGAQAEARPMVGAAPPTVELHVTRTESDPVTRSTRVWLAADGRAGDAGLPVETLGFDVPGAAGFARRVVVSAELDGRFRAVGSGMLYRPRAAQAIGGTEESLRIAVDPVRARRFLVELADDLPVLALARGFAEWRADEVVFRAERAGDHALYVGAAAVAPPAKTLASAEGSIADAHLGQLEPNPRFGVVARRAVPAKPARHRWWLLALVLAAAGLATAAWRRRSRRTRAARSFEAQRGIGPVGP